MAVKPSLALIPSGVKASKVYSVLPSDGTGDFDFSRSGDATRINKDGLIETVGSNIPRLNYPMIDGVVSGCPSLLLEPQRTNLVTYSEDFSDAYWTKSGSSVASGFLSPSGDLSAFKFDEDGTNSYHYCRKLNIAVASASVVTLSMFAKKSENSYVALFEGTVGATVFFNLETKTVVSASGGASGTIEQLSNDWCKITLTVTVSSTKANFEIYNSNDGTSLTYQGVSGNGVYIWGAQLEQQSYATSYIPTQGSVVTRVAEVCSQTVPSGIINSSEGVLYAEISALDSNQGTAGISISNGTTSNRLSIYYSNTPNNVQGDVIVGGVIQGNFSITLGNIEVSQKIAFKFKENDFSVYVNGVSIYEDLVGSVFPISTLTRIGYDAGNGSYPFKGRVKDLRVYNTALTDAELAALTS